MRSARVLIVEDESEWQDIVKELMADEEHLCHTADNYDAALSRISQDSYNVVFLDLILHEFDRSVREGSGWKLLNHLVEQHPRTKIVVLSGRATAGEAVRLMRDYPIAAFIDKGESDVEDQILKAVQQAIKVPSLKIQTFGPFSIWRDGQLIDAWESPEAKLLVKLLLARRVTKARTVAADTLIEALWPGLDPQAARKKLLPVINSARLTLEANIEPRDSHFILRSSSGYYFDMGSHVTWDVRDFGDLIRQAAAKQRDGDLHAAIALYEAARALYIDDFMVTDQNAAWVVPHRQTLQADYRDGLANLADAYAGVGRFADAIRSGEAALKADPLLESVYRQLMRYHYLAGNKAQALKVYRNCEMLFKEMFGEGLSPQTKHLFDLISADAKLESWAAPAESVKRTG
jgi:DNA-binding SARP family transcriptional activator/ActR/RegA family two-component response regulator